VSRTRDESGMVTVFVVTMTLVFLLLAGLVVDGGAVLAAKREAINEAEQAALAGAQAVDVTALRVGAPATLDPVEATAAARAYLAQIGRDGTVEVVGNQVTVNVTIPRRMLILQLAGFGDVTVTGRADARNAHGVTTGDAP
jgi:uncharacterized membrane protein